MGGCKPHYQDTGPTAPSLQRRKVNPSNVFSAPPRAQAIGGTHRVVRSDFFCAGSFDLVEAIAHGHTGTRTHTHTHTHEHANTKMWYRVTNEVSDSKSQL